MGDTSDTSPCLSCGACCRVYAQRPGPCREVQVGDDKCVQARARHGLGRLPRVGTSSES